jgi:hypothetical protein
MKIFRENCSALTGWSDNPSSGLDLFHLAVASGLRFDRLAHGADAEAGTLSRLIDP